MQKNIYIKHRIVPSISMIGKQEWDAVFGDIPEGYDFYRTLEESNLDQFHFLYLTLIKDKKTLLIAPLFIADLNLDIVMDRPLSDFINTTRRYIPRFFTNRTLFCGSPFGENGVIGIRPELTQDEKRHLMLRLVKLMSRISRKKDARLMIFKDFQMHDASPMDHLQESGFFRIESLPSVKMDLDFATTGDYLKSLSYSTRKDLKRKLKKAVDNNVRVECAEEIDDLLDDIYGLYLKTYEAGKTKFEKLTKQFFTSVIKNLGPDSKFFLYYAEGRLAAFNLCFVHKDTLIDKFIGFDYNLSTKYGLYAVSWFYNIEWCLKNGMKYYQVGQTDYGPKLSLGGKAVPLKVYGRHSNPITNASLVTLAKLLRL